MKLYCKEHLWLERSGNDWLLGLTDYAIAMLGEIIWLEFSNSRDCELGMESAVAGRSGTAQPFTGAAGVVLPFAECTA